MGLSAHLWTVWPVMRDKLRPPPSVTGEEWSLEVQDPDVGPVRLTGFLHGASRADSLVVLVHGLGGSTASRYHGWAVQAAEELGLATLRVNMRGSDRRGADLYHAGLSSDLAAVLCCPELAKMKHLYVMGYSLGGHMALKLATEVDDDRLRGVAAVCSPLDLDRTVTAFDRPSRSLYRRYILSGLCEIYDEIAQRREMPVSTEALRRVKTLREWDSLTVVPRFGFADAEDYYRSAGVGSRLSELRVPALLVAAEDDPMVDADGIRPALEGDHSRLEVRWFRRGGHVSFPANLDLGFGPPFGLDAQVMRWLLQKAATQPAAAAATSASKTAV